MEYRNNHFKRLSARPITNIEAHISANGHTNSVILTNLSDSGIQMQCNRQTLDQLMPNIQRPDPHQPIQISVQFTLSGDNSQNTEIKAVCRMLYVRRLAQDHFLSGGEFIDISDGSATAVAAYLRQLLRN